MGGVPLRPGPFFLLLAILLVGAGAGAGLVLMRETGWAAGAVGLAGGAVVGAHRWAREAPRLVLLAGLAERVLDAVVLGAIAWVAVPEHFGVATAAVLALGTSYLAAYLRVRASGLGFPVVEPPLFRLARPLLVAVGLLADLLLVSLWAVSAISVGILIREVAQLDRQRAPR